MEKFGKKVQLVIWYLRFHSWSATSALSLLFLKAMSYWQVCSVMLVHRLLYYQTDIHTSFGNICLTETIDFDINLRYFPAIVKSLREYDCLKHYHFLHLLSGQAHVWIFLSFTIWSMVPCAGTPKGVGPVKIGQKIEAGITGLLDVHFDVERRSKVIHWWGNYIRFCSS